MNNLDWHGREPFVKYFMDSTPWEKRAEFEFSVNQLHMTAMGIFTQPDLRSSIYTDPNAKYAWWDGSCLCTDLMIEGPKSIVKWEPR